MLLITYASRELSSATHAACPTRSSRAAPHAAVSSNLPNLGISSELIPKTRKYCYYLARRTRAAIKTARETMRAAAYTTRPLGSGSGADKLGCRPLNFLERCTPKD
jgi:hypothetical protein